MSQRANLPTRNLYLPHSKEFELFEWCSVQFFQQRPCIWPLKLKSICPPGFRIGNRSLVAFESDVVPPSFCVILNPVCHGWATHNIDFVVFETEQNHITDYIALVAAADELFCFVAAVTPERI